MKYERLGSIISQFTPREKPAGKKSKLSEEQIEKLKTVGNIALAVLAAGSILTMSAIAPNIFMAIDKLFLKKKRSFGKRDKDIKIAQAFYYMKRSRYIIMRPAGRDLKVFLTKLGKKKIAQLNIATMDIRRSKKWNGKWWEIAADIPTKKYKNGADLFRQKLKDMKFFPLQRTLWIYPFDPRQEIEHIVNYYGIGRFVTAMEISRLDWDDEIRIKTFFEENNIL